MPRPKYLGEVPIPKPPPFPDPHLRWLSDVAKPWKGSGQVDVGIIGIPFDRGVASHRQGTRFGPSALRTELYASSDYCVHHDVVFSKAELVDLGDVDVDVMNYDETHRRVEEVMSEVFREINAPIISLGGDHSLAAPIIKGLTSSMKGKRVGIIDFDSHHDIRSGWTKNSGLWSREILEFGGNPVSGRNFAQIGVHGYRYSEYYHEQLKKYGIKTFTPLDVRAKTMETVVEEALGYASDGTDAIYLSVDIDVLDQVYAPGTNSGYPGGLVPQDLMVGVFEVGRHPLIRAMDLMEVSPPLDIGNITVRQGTEVILSFLCGLMKNKRIKSRNAERKTGGRKAK